LIRLAMPTTADAAWVERALAIAREPGQDPTVRSTLLTGADTMGRVLRART
jgi:hypothetical protein